MGQWDLPEDEQQALISMRRDLHIHPELSWKETRTSATVARELKALGLHPKEGVAGTGVYADIGEGGPLIALRADMDALPIQEETEVPFASQTPGVMHACGHDAHTACLIAVAKRLVASPPTEGRVRLLFQPAEEIGSGAEVMLQEGALQDKDLAGIYGLHFWSQLQTGTVGVVPGAMMGSVDLFEITVKGKGGHGAEPHMCADALVAAAHLVTNLQTIVSRRLNPLAPAVVSVGKFESGTAFNVIPEQATLVGTVRTMDRETWSAIPSLLEQVATHSVAALGCEASVNLQRVQKPLINDKEAAQLATEAAQELLSSEQITPFRTLAGEDFAAYLEQVKGCFFFVGAGGTGDALKQPPHHNPKFILDEDAFPLGVRLLEGCARRALQEALP